MIKFIVDASRLISLLGAGAMLVSAIGQALTGGLRLEARPVEIHMPAFDAAMLFLWLVAIVVSAAAGFLEDEAR